MSRSVYTVTKKLSPDNIEKAITEIRTGLAKFKAEHNLTNDNLAEIVGTTPRIMRRWLATGQGRMNFNHLLRLRKFMTRNGLGFPV